MNRAVIAQKRTYGYEEADRRVSRPRDSSNKFLSFYVTRVLIFPVAPDIRSLQLPSKYLSYDLISTPYNPSYINTFGTTPPPPPPNKKAKTQPYYFFF